MLTRTRGGDRPVFAPVWGRPSRAVCCDGKRTREFGMILVGTAGWADRDLIASGWYPASVNSPAGRLAYYAGRFPLVEIDSSYYAIPADRTVQGWAENSSGLVLDAKAYSLLTGQRTRLTSLPAQLRPLAHTDWITAESASPALLDATWEYFHACFEPLRQT